MANTLGERLKQLRKEFNLSQQDIANRLGLKSKVSISDYETGKTTPSLEDLQALARMFKTTIDFLVTGEHNTESRIMNELHKREKELEELKYKIYKLVDNADNFKQVADKKEKYK